MGDTLLFFGELYGIPLICTVAIGTGLFFLFRRLLKDVFTTPRKRNFFIWFSTILIAPIVSAALLWAVLAIWCYYPDRAFDPKNWRKDSNKRYEYSGDIVNKKVLSGKTEKQVNILLGEPDMIDNYLNTWNYDLGKVPGPDIFNVVESGLVVQFDNGRVINVGEHAFDPPGFGNVH
jgi:hypothetical protein